MVFFSKRQISEYTRRPASFRLLTSKTTPPITDITDWSVVAAGNVFREWNLIAQQFRDVIVADADSGAREVAPEFVIWVSATLIGSMLQRSSIWLERIKQVRSLT